MNKQYYQPPISGGCFLCTKMPVYSSHAGKLPHKLGKTDKDTSISGSIKQVALKYQDVIAKQMKERQLTGLFILTLLTFVYLICH